MKNKILALMATIGLASSASAIEINDNLSINGFIDGSYGHADISGNGETAEASVLGIDEVELNFLVNAGNVSGALHIDSEDATGDTDLSIEQVHFTYNLDNGVSFTFGRYGSALGFEREDPAGLYTFSRAYSGGSALVEVYNDAVNAGTIAGPALSTPSFNLGDVDSASVEGITVAYAGEGFSLAASFEEASDADLEASDLNIELFASYTGIENVVIGVGYFIDNGNDDGPDGIAGNADDGQETDLLNIHASYSFGKGLIAAEYIDADSDAAGAGEEAYMILADYDFTEKLGAAVRYSSSEVVSGIEAETFTIAPNFQITESLGAILEYSDYDLDGTNVDGDLLAIELTYTF